MSSGSVRAAYLLDDRTSGGASHQKQQAGVSERNRRFRHEFGRRAVLRVGVGDVQSHASRSGGADLQVEAGASVPHCPVENHHVADQLRYRLGEDQRLDIVGNDVRRRRGVDLQAVHAALGELRCRVDILIGDRGRGVDRVDHNIRTVAVDQMGELRTLVGLVDRPEKVIEDAFPGVFVLEEVSPGPLRELLPGENVPPLTDELRLALREEGPKVLDGLLDTLFVERDEAIPVLALGEVLDQEAKRFFVAGGEQESRSRSTGKQRRRETDDGSGRRSDRRFEHGPSGRQQRRSCQRSPGSEQAGKCERSQACQHRDAE